MVRRALYSVAVVPVWLLLSGFSIARWPSCAALAASAVLALIGVLVADLCLWNFRKLPFACAYSAGKANLHILIWGTLLLLIPLVEHAGILEERLLQSWAGRALLLGVLGVCAYAARRLTSARTQVSRESLIFEASVAEELTSLQLGMRTRASSSP